MVTLCGNLACCQEPFACPKKGLSKDGDASVGEILSFLHSSLGKRHHV